MALTNKDSTKNSREGFHSSAPKILGWTYWLNNKNNVCVCPHVLPELVIQCFEDVLSLVFASFLVII